MNSYCDDNREKFHLGLRIICTLLLLIQPSAFRPYERVANIMGMTVAAVRMKVSCGARITPATPPPSPPPPVFDNFTVGAIRRLIHQKFADKQYFTVKSLTVDLKTAGITGDISETSVLRLLKAMGFRYRASQRKMYVRKESLDIVCRRIAALRALRHYREAGRQVVYVDEIWFTTRMGHSLEWVDSVQPATSATYSRQVPPGEGERFVVIAGGTTDGFVEDSFLCYQAKTKQGDYHGEMNGELFLRWLTTHLLPSLPEPSVIVLDNAPYHNILVEDSRCPTTATKKADLIRWLELRRLSYPSSATRPELLQICRKNRPEPRYKVDNCIREWGHEAVRLPPAHPELNAIEQVWGCMKRHVRSSLQRFTRTDLRARLEEARLCANHDVWTGAVRHSQHFEEEYWTSDNIHESVEPVIINVASDDEDGEDDLFLDSGDE